jgi:hypothetical protein
MSRSRIPVGRAKVTLTLALTGYGDVDHEGATRTAWLTDVYGLVIHTSVISNAAARWAVSHTRSGYAIGYADTWEDALYLADRLGECGPWNRDLNEIIGDRDFRTKSSEAVRRHGKQSYQRPAGSVWG